MPRYTIPIILAALALGYMLGYVHSVLRLRPTSQQPTTTQTPIPASQTSQPFPQVIQSSTGHKVLPITPTDQPVLDAIANAADAALEKFNAPNSPLKGLPRINEASRFFEDSLRTLLDDHPDLACSIPVTSAGTIQRSGYPDLRIVHLPTNKIYYLDPKLYESSSETSTLRTFYYTPKSKTSKITSSASHLLIGFAHNGDNNHWQFLSWKLVDLNTIKLSLKTEYNASNKELYLTPRILQRSSK
ncbi:MAG: hypothetical protein AAGC74_13715 [Verrucomicrobiota bacterium]